MRAQFIKIAPHPAASFQPAGGAIVNLPTIFSAGPGPTFTAAPAEIAGYDVAITATATYTWNFDDGVTRTFSVPGGGYPDRSVSWTYDDRGTRDVTVTISWAGRYSVDGGDLQDVPGGPVEITSDPLAVRVRAARAELVSGAAGARR